MIATLSFSFVLGVWLISMLPKNNFGLSVWLVVGCFWGFIGFIVKQRIVAIPIVILAGLILGLWRGSPMANEVYYINSSYGQIVEVVGRLPDDPKTESSGRLSFRLSQINFEGKEIDGIVWVQAESSDMTIKRSDTVKVEGQLQPGFGGFVGSLKDAKILEISPTSQLDYGLSVRNQFAGMVKSTISEPESSLGLGFLVGQQSDLPDELLTSIKIVGLTHIIVASGYNLTILVRFARKLFEKVSKYLSAVASLAVIFGFITITGWSPSMTRAGLVALVSLAAWYYGRKLHPVVLLCFVAGLTVLINPSYAWGDLGWQLSFTSFAGILILAPLLRAYFFADKGDNAVTRILVETFAAYIMTLPLVATVTGNVSTVAIFSNLFVLPIIPFIMLLTFASGLASLVGGWLSQFIGWITYQLLHYVVWISSYLSSFSWSTIKIDMNGFATIIWYLAIVTIIFYLKKVTGLKLDQTNIVN